MELDSELSTLKQQVRALGEEVGEANLELKKAAHERDDLKKAKAEAAGVVGTRWMGVLQCCMGSACLLAPPPPPLSLLSCLPAYLQVDRLLRANSWIESEQRFFGQEGTAFEIRKGEAARDPDMCRQRLKSLQANQVRVGTETETGCRLGRARGQV